MKIDQDLRAVINAAAKAQPEMGWSERSEIIAKAVAAFLKKRPALTKKVNSLIAKSRELQAKQLEVQEQIHKSLGPLGLRASSNVIEGNFSDWADDRDADTFIAAGGVLPPPRKVKWKAEKLIAQLAAADPKNRDAILKEYGINWA
jgi:hypothetical protein